MFKHTRTAVKFFVYGLVAGLLFAPRSGEETRKELHKWVNQTFKETMGGMMGGGGGSQQA